MDFEVSSLRRHLTYIEAVEKLIAEYLRGKKNNEGCPFCKALDVLGVHSEDSCELACPWYLFESKSCTEWLADNYYGAVWASVHWQPEYHKDIRQERLRMLAEWHQALLTGEVIYAV